MESQIHVKSHVGRDLLQSASLFGKEDKVIWEYVSNGLQYVDDGNNPIVKVTLESKNKKITIEDNGRGMDWDGLQNFFIMHGENIDRKMVSFR
jgi:HSP90 family molecular chaperone